MTETAEEFIAEKKKTESGREFWIKDIRRNGVSHCFKVLGVTYLQESDNPEKVFEIKKVEYQRTKGIENHTIPESHKITIRCGYWIVGKIGRANGKWWWGQYAPMIPIKDFLLLIEKAKREGTIIEEY